MRYDFEERKNVVIGKGKYNMINQFRGENEFLSNFYPCDINIDGIHYPSVEHAFQAMKSCSYLERLKVAQAATPDKAKYLGRRIKLRNDWEDIKNNIMEKCLRKKFSEKNPHLMKKLKDTNKEELIEGNVWHDNYWGDCKCQKCQNKTGLNNLGKLLMKIREGL